MNSDCKMIFEGYVDGITRKKRELAGSLMDIIRYGIPEEKQIPELKNRLKEQFAAVKNGVRLSTDEIEEGRRIMGKLRAAGMSRQDLEDLYKQAGKVKKEAEFTAQDFVKDSEKHNEIPGKEENAENEPHGYPQGMTAIQNALINVLKKHGFKLNKIGHADKDRDAYPTVFMVRKSGPMHKVAEIDGMGAINGEHYEKYVADLKDEAELDELHGRGEAEHYAHKEEDAESDATQRIVKQTKMLINNALRNVFAAIETLDGVDSLPYASEVDALMVNLDEEVARLMDALDEKMLKVEAEEQSMCQAAKDGCNCDGCKECQANQNQQVKF